MRESLSLIDKARELCEPPSWYQLAKRLGVNHATLSRVINRGGTLDNESCVKLAALLGTPVIDVIAVMEKDRARTPKKREFWESLGRPVTGPRRLRRPRRSTRGG
jgi:transcriptional regulator with XRE-family HTH domain